MRTWKVELKRRCDLFERNYERRQEVLLPVIAGFVRKRSVGQQRAFKKLRQLLGPGAYLEGVRFHPIPIAVFSMLRPRDSITIDAPVDTGLMQDCVTMNYILAGELPEDRTSLTKVGVAEGYWTLEIPDHAIGRCIHRTGELPDKIIYECHHNILKLNPGLVMDGENHFNNDARFNVRAGPGGFVCTFRVGEEVSRKEYMARVRADTWIPEEDGGHQGLLVGHGEPGHRLVDNWLVPAPMRRLYREGAGIKLEVHTSMPELKL